MNFNRVVLVGRISNNVTLRQTRSGINYARFTVVVNKRLIRNRGSATNYNDVYYIPVICWREKAEYVTNYLLKGSLILIEGEISSSRYTDDTGKIINTVEVLVLQINSLETISAINQRKNAILDSTKKDENFSEDQELNYFNTEDFLNYEADDDSDEVLEDDEEDKKVLEEAIKSVNEEEKLMKSLRSKEFYKNKSDSQAQKSVDDPELKGGFFDDDDFWDF